MIKNNKKIIPTVFGTKSERYKNWIRLGIGNTNNGAHHYAREIEDIILPELELTNSIVTAGAGLYKPHEIPDGSIILCHNNKTPGKSYRALFRKNMLWVCSKESTVEKMEAFRERAVYIPLSIDTQYVAQFKTEKTREIAFVGNPWGFKREYLASLPKHIDQLNGLSRKELLMEMAKYKKVIAEGRCLMEAQVLGCEGEIPDYNDPSLGTVFVEPLDNRDVIEHWRELFLPNPNLIIVKTNRAFFDAHARVYRKVNDEFIVTQERLTELLNHRLELVKQL